MQWVKLDKHQNMLIDSLELRSILQLNIEGALVSFCKVNNEIYAFKDRCPHAGASLSEGGCNKYGIVSCPLHGYKFDVTKGKSSDGHQYVLTTYSLKLDDNSIHIYI